MQSEPGAVLLLRIDSVGTLDRALEGWLREIHPHGDVRDPLRMHLGAFLRNDGLQGLPEPAFVEVLWLLTTSGLHEVAVFPVEDTVAYERQLARQISVRHEGRQGALIAYREETPDRSQALYLGFTPHRLACFGFDAEAVERALRLYEDTVGRGLLFAGDGDVRARLELRRLMTLQREPILAGLERLRSDILADLFPLPPEEGHPLGLALRELLRLGRVTAEQVATLEATADLQPEAWRTTLRVEPVAESPLARLVADAPERNLQIAGGLPAEALSWDVSALWPRLWQPLLEAAAQVYRTSAGPLYDEVIRAGGRALQDALERAQPLAAASALVVPEGDSAPVRVQFVQWRRPALATNVLDAATALLASEGLRDLLEQQGVELSIETKNRIDVVGELPVDRLRVRVRLETEDDPRAGDAGARVMVREYLLMRMGDQLISVTSRELDAAATTERALAARAACLAVLRDVAGGIAGTRPSLRGRADYRALLQHQDAGRLAAGALELTGWLNLLQGREPAEQTDAADKATDKAIRWSARQSGQGLVVESVWPHRPVRLAARRLLGLEEMRDE